MVEEDILNRIVALTDDAVLCVDDALRITFFNQGAEQIFGHRSEDVIGKALHILLPASVLAHHDRFVRAFGESEEPPRPSPAERQDVTGRRADGTEFPARVHVIRGAPGSTTAFAAILKDVTVERVYQQQLIKGLDERAQFIAAINASHASVSVADVTQPHAPLVYVSDGFEQLTGYPQAEVLGRSCSFLQGVDTDAETVQAIRWAIARREAITVTLRNYRRDGSPFWNQLTLTPVTAPDGLVTAYVGVQVDVSDTFHRRDPFVKPANSNKLRVVAGT